MAELERITVNGRVKKVLTAADLGRLSSRLQEFVAEGTVAGVVSLVWQAGEVIQADAYGFQDLASRTPMSRKSVFQIASQTKPIVSLVALQLMEEGKLTLDDAISRWIPELARLQVLVDPDGPVSESVAAPRDITVEDLLTHRSGLTYGFLSSTPIAHAVYESLGTPLETPLTPDEWLAALGRIPLRYAPGERFEYGHSTEVLGLLVSRIEGKSLGQVLQSRVFDRLGMVDTGFFVPPAKLDRLARTYALTPGGFVDRTVPVKTAPPVFEAGGGGLYSTADDYLTFARLMLGQGELDGERLVAPDTLRMMTQDRLTPRQHELPALGRALFAAQGFGLGVSIIQDPERIGPIGVGPAGCFGWPGAYGTWWQADPVNELVALFMIQDHISLAPPANDAIAVPAPSRIAQFEYRELLYKAVGTLRPGVVGPLDHLVECE
ncbi:class A beta-lactamase-related serine hydrolase [Rhodococcus sp. WS4]|nr:class A beta-lactamase-related serine hydrolase [Rhodococcus sp. WS4]